VVHLPLVLPEAQQAQGQVQPEAQGQPGVQVQDEEDNKMNLPERLLRSLSGFFYILLKKIKHNYEKNINIHYSYLTY